MTDVLHKETEGRLRVLRLNRPERKNALNGELIDGIITAVGPLGEVHLSQYPGAWWRPGVSPFRAQSGSHGDAEAWAHTETRRTRRF